jgi:ADP-heptose:LPS heptosyltransferase
MRSLLRERGNPVLHYVDRYSGIPAVAFLACMRRKRSLPMEITSIGLIKAGAIGDTVLISAIIADLRSAFPNASITFFAGESNFEIAEMLEGVNRVIKLPMLNPLAAVRAIRSVPVDVLLDFGQWSRADALLSLLCRSRFTIGFRTRGQYRHYGYDLAREHSSDVHELDNFRSLVYPLGADAQNVPSLRASENASVLSGEYLAFHLWPGGRRRQLKEWPAERWLRLVEEFAKPEMGVVLTGSASDRQRNDDLIASAVSHARPFVRNTAGSSLRETTAILARASFVVSVDTGLMHMAAALRVPVVALHGPSPSKRWGPVSQAAIVVESPITGCGYINHGWESLPDTPACMEGISFEMVRDACLVMLKNRSSFLPNLTANAACSLRS